MFSNPFRSVSVRDLLFFFFQIYQRKLESSVEMTATAYLPTFVIQGKLPLSPLPARSSNWHWHRTLSCDVHHLLSPSRQDWKDNSLALAEAKKARLVIRAVSRVQSFSSTPGIKTFGSSPGKQLAPPPLGRSSLPGKLAPPPGGGGGGGGSGAGTSTAARRRWVLCGNAAVLCWRSFFCNTVHVSGCGSLLNCT